MIRTKFEIGEIDEFGVSVHCVYNEMEIQRFTGINYLGGMGIYYRARG